MKYFTIKELERSAVAQFQAIDNTIPLLERDAAVRFVETVLNPLREAFSKPIVVTSGYRCHELNRLVGGSRTSQHLMGTAADISAVDAKDNRVLWQLLSQHAVDFDQAILYGDYEFIHVGWKPVGANRRQLLLRPHLGSGYRQD